VFILHVATGPTANGECKLGSEANPREGQNPDVISPEGRPAVKM